MNGQRAPHILSTTRDAFGNTLGIALQQALYCVGTVSSHGRFVPLAKATYSTLARAEARLRQELAERQAALSAPHTTEGDL
jgi:hypothetical protein